MLTCESVVAALVSTSDGLHEQLAIVDRLRGSELARKHTARSQHADRVGGRNAYLELFVTEEGAPHTLCLGLPCCEHDVASLPTCI